MASKIKRKQKLYIDSGRKFRVDFEIDTKNISFHTKTSHLVDKHLIWLTSQTTQNRIFFSFWVNSIQS